MARPHLAALVEDAVNRRVNGALVRRGWTNRAIAHTGYGSTSFVRVLGRVVLARPDVDDVPPEQNPRTAVGGDEALAEARAELRLGTASVNALRLRAEERVRGWRAFITAQAPDAAVLVKVGSVEREVRTDRSGYIDAVLEGHGLEPGWHEATIAPIGGRPTQTPVQIIGPDVRFGLVSDIDDTVMITSLPRPMIAAWNTFVLHEQARHIVPGMAQMYRELLAGHPGAPIFYLSTGAWNTSGTLTRFLARHGYPTGPLLLTDWGPTNTGWFRSGQQHKRENLHRLAREFPHIRWLLVGDDGQHDPRIYGDFARDRSDVVRVIAIRELTPAEQVLSHGLPVSNEEFAPRVHRPVPIIRAADGHGLLPRIRAVLAGSDAIS